jgi:WD40 repeat protein
MARRYYFWLGLSVIAGVTVGLIWVRFIRDEPSAPPGPEPAAAADPAVDLPPEPPLPAGAIARLGTALFQAPANHLVFTVDGKSFFGSNWSGVRQIDLKTGRVIHEYTPAQLGGYDLDHQVTPDGRFLAEKATSQEWISSEGPSDERVRIREWPGGKTLHEVQPRGGFMIVSPDASRVAVVGAWSPGEFGTNSVAIIDVPSGRQTSVRLNENRILADAIFRPATAELLVVDWGYGSGLEHTDARLRRFDLSGQRPVEVGSFSFQGNEQRTMLAVSADGRRLAAIGSRDSIQPRAGQRPKIDFIQDRRLQLWEIPRGERIANPELGHERVWHLCFLPDGSLLTLGSADGLGIIRHWEGPDWRQTVVWGIPNWNGGRAAVSPDGKTLLIGSASGHIRRFEIDAAREYPSRPTHSAAVTEITFADDGTVITWSQAPLAWDIVTGAPRDVPAGAQRPGPPPGPILEDPPLAGSHIVRDAAGQFAVAAWGEWNNPTTIAGWDGATGRRLWVTQFRPGAYPMGFAPDGRQVYVNDRALVALDAMTGREAFRWDLVDRGVVSKDAMCNCRVWVVPGGEQLLLRSYPDGLRLIDARSGNLIQKLTPHAREPLALSSDGRLAAATMSQEPGTVVVWDLRTGERQHTFTTGHLRISAVGFSPKSDRLVTGGYDGTSIVWDLTVK